MTILIDYIKFAERVFLYFGRCAWNSLFFSVALQDRY